MPRTPNTPDTPNTLDRHATRLVALLGLTDSEAHQHAAHYDALPATRHVTAMERAVRAMAPARQAARGADSAR